MNEDENSHRRLAGEPEIHIIDWIQNPTLNPETRTVTWVMKVDDAGSFISNVVALRLGRYGIERLTFADQAEDMFAINRRLELAMNAIAFHDGARYSDYQPGVDRKAGVDVAGAVNDTMLGRAMTGAAAGIIIPILTALTRASIGLVLIPVYWAFKAGRRNITKTSNET
jgi:uncharacterized membrane-anchored protein